MPEIHLDFEPHAFDYIIIPNCRGGGKTRFYTRQHHPRYYADDPHDMEILEEVDSEQVTVNN